MHCDGQGLDRARRSFDIVLSIDTTRSSAALTGELDIAHTARLQGVLDRLRGDGHLDIMIDIGGLHFVDAAGLGVLARAHSEFGAAGGRVVLTRAQPWHRRLLALTALDAVLVVEVE